MALITSILDNNRPNYCQLSTIAGGGKKKISYLASELELTIGWHPKSVSELKRIEEKARSLIKAMYEKHGYGTSSLHIEQGDENWPDHHISVKFELPAEAGK